jgi:hypothetical protein
VKKYLAMTPPESLLVVKENVARSFGLLDSRIIRRKEKILIYNRPEIYKRGDQHE